MKNNLKPGIVRILKPDGVTAGTGFVVSEQGLVATCTHVVWPQEARNTGLPRPDTVPLVFLATEDTDVAQVVGGWWRHPDEEDLVILRTLGTLPEGVVPLKMARWYENHIQSFRAFGFPALNPENGIWTTGEILGETKINGMRALQLSSPQATLGFSGAPIWIEKYRQVVGMVTTIASPDRYARLGETAFAVPIDMLVGICAEPLEPLLVDSEEDLLREFTALGQQRKGAKTKLIEVLRQATKLYTGEWAEVFTGTPRTKLRQHCLTQASKWPRSRHVDVKLLKQVSPDLGDLEWEMRHLLAAWRRERMPGSWHALERRGRLMGNYLRRIYGIESDGSFDLGATE